MTHSRIPVKAHRIKRTLLFFVVTLLFAWEVQGQDNRSTWLPPQVLGDGWWQTIAVDRQGAAHIGWYGHVDGLEDDNPGNDTDALMYISRLSDGTWTSPNNVLVTGVGGFTVRNSLAVTSDGMLHAVFRAGTRHQFSNTLAGAAASAGNWNSPQLVSHDGYYVDMTADENDVLHIVFSGRESDISDLPVILEGDPCPLCYDLYYRRSTDGGSSWTPPYNLTHDEDAGSDRPDIWVGSSGRLYLVWDVGRDWYIGRGTPQGIGFRYSDDGGITWSETTLLDGGGDSELRPIQAAATELRDGSVMVVWRYSQDDDRRIYFQMSSDLETWTEPQPIEGLYARSATDCSIDDYELRADPLGIAHLFVVGQPTLDTGANPSLYHIEYRQGRWVIPQRVFYSTEAQPEWPKVSVGVQGDIHLTWFVRGIPEGTTSLESCTGGLKVYYSYRGPVLGNQPTLAFNPTRTPQPTPTLVQILETTATPLPQVQPLDNVVVNTTRDMYAIQTVVGGSLAVAVLCAAIIAISRFWRR